ncbi:hypothetical protein MMC28_008053 [Mycoblastus sanguinarius]|nr:hypothetical protein [Mycoblastus sanguinarius]
MITERLPQVASMLRRIHDAKPQKWMKRYDPLKIVRQQLECVKACKAMPTNDIGFIEGIHNGTAENIKDHPWVPCHNDFHSHNVMLVRTDRDDTESLFAIDFEDCDLGDPMWDLAYLTVNLVMERKPYALEYLYGAGAEGRRRIRAYVPLALTHCATWAALHGVAWAQHQKELMERLREVVVT